ncbi:TonB-dependent receptor plug domain-containing protein [Deminuibacter soli]|nr:TonB-dependent receptor [Deminuibacter soli]
MKKLMYTFAALAVSQGAWAQKDSAANKLDEVVVTATKTPAKLSQIGKVVTVITKEQIEQSAGKDLSQLLNEQTGIIVNGANSNPGLNKSLYMLGAKNDYTLILIDGAPLLDASGLTVGAYDLRMIPLEQVERIEIVQGSESTLYGSNAVAGVINIITKKGGSKKIGFTGTSSYGSYHTYNGNANVHGTTGIVDYNVNYNYYSTHGISEAADTTGKGNFDKDGFNRQSVQANLSINASKNLKIAPFYRYAYYKGAYDDGAFTDGINNFTSLLNSTGAIATYQLPKGTITANYTYNFSKREYDAGYNFRGRFHNGDLYWKQSLGQLVQMVAGVNYQHYQLLDTSLTEKNPAHNITSPYLSFLLNSKDGLSLEIGSRYNSSNHFGSYFTYNFTAAYRVTSYLKLFAGTSTGFRAPLPSELFGSFGANPNLKPEKSTNIEGGAQAELLKSNLFVTLTGFNREMKDVIAFLNGVNTNLDAQHDKGAQVEVKWQPVQGLNIKAAYAYVTGRITETNAGKDTSYYNLLRVPKSTFNFNVGYQATRQLYVSAGLQSLGKRTDAFFNLTDYSSSPVTLKSFATLNLYAEYKLLHNKLRLFADAKNVTGTKYYEVYGYSTMGFNFTGGLAINL